jgi:hypothetical protein
MKHGMTRLLTAAGFMAGLTFSGWALADEEIVYGHCTMLTGTTRTVVYISSVYRIKHDPLSSSIGIGNSFYDHVNARYGIDRYISPSCGTYYKSYQEAEDARNKQIAGYRHSSYGEEVRLVDWVYGGSRHRH